jgi:hypothetical protein
MPDSWLSVEQIDRRRQLGTVPSTLQLAGGGLDPRDRVGITLVSVPDLLAALASHVTRLLVLYGPRHHEGEKDRGSFHIQQFATGWDFRLTAT